MHSRVSILHGLFVITVQLPHLRLTKNVLSSWWDSALLRGWRPWPWATWCYAPVPECSHKCEFPSRCPITPSLICLNQPCLLPLPLKVTCFTIRKPHGSPFLSPLISSVVGAFPGFWLIHCDAGRPASVLTASLSGRSDLPFR